VQKGKKKCLRNTYYSKQSTGEPPKCLQKLQGSTKLSPEAHMSLGFSCGTKKPVMPKKKVFVTRNLEDS
jgi:hypothetical protein